MSFQKQSCEGDPLNDDVALHNTSQQVIHVINVIAVQFTGSKGWQESPKRCKGLQWVISLWCEPFLTDPQYFMNEIILIEHPRYDIINNSNKRPGNELETSHLVIHIFHAILFELLNTLREYTFDN